MKKPDIYILANSRKIRALRTVPGDPSLGEGRDAEHLTEVQLEPTLAQPESGYEERSDRLGRFERGMPAGSQAGMGHGERHSESAESKRRQTATLSQSIETILTDQEHASWALIAPDHLLSEVVEALGDPFTSSLASRQSGDWTGQPIAQIEARLLRGSS